LYKNNADLLDPPSKKENCLNLISSFELQTIIVRRNCYERPRPQKKGVKKIGSSGVKRKTPYSEAGLCT